MMTLTASNRHDRRGPRAGWGPAGLRVLGSGLFIVLSGCAIGPAYHKPVPPALARYTATRIPPVAGAPVFEYGKTQVPAWWQEFHSPSLSALVAQALVHNPTLEAATSSLREAQENLVAAQGIFYPQVTANLSAAHQRTSGSGFGGSVPGKIFSVYSGGVNVSYDPDVFGISELVYRQAKASEDIARDSLDAARLTIEGNVAATVLNAASYRAQISATRSIVGTEQRILVLTKNQYRAGAVPYVDVLTQQSQLASDEATLPSLLQAYDQAQDALAILVGRFPARWQEVRFRLAALRLPDRLPVGLPSRLVAERPDIRAAEAQLRVANAQLGEAVARMYPLFQITAGWGHESSTVGTFLDSANNIWNVMGALSAPIFEGGTLEAQKRAAQAAYGAVFADYKSTVLNAFQQVADSLNALDHDVAALDAQRAALASASSALVLSRDDYRAGAISYPSLLAAEVQYSRTRIAFVRALAARYLDTVALNVALGGSLPRADLRRSAGTQ